MADTPMCPIGQLRVNAVELAHTCQQIGIGRFYQQVAVVAHQAIGHALSTQSVCTPAPAQTAKLGDLHRHGKRPRACRRVR